MIKALLLVISPIPAWDRIVAAPRKWTSIFFTHTLPLLLLTSLVEGWGFVRWGKTRGDIIAPKVFSVPEAILFEALQLVLTVVALFVCTGLVKSLAATFRGGRTFDQSFTVMAYGLSPVFLFRVMDALPSLWPWVSWAIGICLAIRILYHGLPRVMVPELPQAFGFFLSSIVLAAFVTALVRFLAAMYLMGKLEKFEAVLSGFAQHL